MYVWFRAGRVLAMARLAAKKHGPLAPLSKVSTSLRIGPQDIDLLGHLNNGRYLTLFDLGRFDLAERTGMLSAMTTRHWHPVVASAAIRFRRSLQLFDAVTLTTQIVYWDERWFYLEQHFEKDGQVYAKALIKGAVRDRRGRSVPLSEVLIALGETERTVPDIPPEILSWRQFEEDFR